MWFKHPKYITTRQRFVSEFLPWKLTILHHFLPKIVFICGGNEEQFKNRRAIEDYFLKYYPQLLFFRAENAWDTISKDSNENALALEEWLADFSDIVIILVESFGTVAELGAFSLSEKLRSKLLPILDSKYAGDESFINTGPIRWVDKDSKYKPSIVTNFDTILTCMPEVEKRLEIRTISTNNARRFGTFNFTSKVMLFFLVFTISAVGPITLHELVGISNEIIRYKNKQQISFIISIGVALNIIQVTTVNSTEFFSCINYRKLFRGQFTESFLNNLQLSRAKSLSSLLTIPEFNTVLKKIIANAA